MQLLYIAITALEGAMGGYFWTICIARGMSQDSLTADTMGLECTTVATMVMLESGAEVQSSFHTCQCYTAQSAMHAKPIHSFINYHMNMQFLASCFDEDVKEIAFPNQWFA